MGHLNEFVLLSYQVHLSIVSFKKKNKKKRVYLSDC